MTLYNLVITAYYFFYVHREDYLLGAHAHEYKTRSSIVYYGPFHTAVFKSVGFSFVNQDKKDLCEDHSAPMALINSGQEIGVKKSTHLIRTKARVCPYELSCTTEHVGSSFQELHAYIHPCV